MRKLLTLIGFLFAPAVCHAQLGPSCGNTTPSGSNTVSCSITLNSLTLGGTIVAASNMEAGVSGSLSSITDTCGLTWTTIESGLTTPTSSHPNYKQYYLYANTGSCTGTETVTMTNSQTVTGGGINVIDLPTATSLTPQDGSTVVNNGTNTCTASTDCTVTVTTTNQYDAILSLWFTIGVFPTPGPTCCDLAQNVTTGATIVSWPNVTGSFTQFVTTTAINSWQGVAVAFKVSSPQSPFLIQSNVYCSETLATIITCPYQLNVTAGNGLVIGIETKRGVTPLSPVTISDTLNIAGTSGWHCIPVGPDVPQGVAGVICAGFPASSGAETVTFTYTGGGGTTQPVQVFVTEWKPNVFFPCKDSCTFLGGAPVVNSTSVVLSTSSTSGYVNNFSIAFTDNTFPVSCAENFWTVPSGSSFILSGRIPLLAYAFQPNTSGTDITMTMNCGTGNTNGIVWGGELFSSTYFPNNPPRKSQVY